MHRRKVSEYSNPLSQVMNTQDQNKKPSCTETTRLRCTNIGPKGITSRLHFVPDQVYCYIFNMSTLNLNVSYK